MKQKVNQQCSRSYTIQFSGIICWWFINLVDLFKPRFLSALSVPVMDVAITLWVPVPSGKAAIFTRRQLCRQSHDGVRRIRGLEPWWIFLLKSLGTESSRHGSAQIGEVWAASWGHWATAQTHPCGNEPPANVIGRIVTSAWSSHRV